MQVRVLGALEVSSGRRQIEIGAPKQRRVLAALVSRVGEVVSVDALVEAVWDGRPPRSASKTLQGYIVHLRQVLSAADDVSLVIVTTGVGYRLDVADDAIDAIDATSFGSLVGKARDCAARREWSRARLFLDEALSLWHGPAYEDVADCGFVAAEATRLRELWLVALELRVEADLSLGEDVTLLPQLEKAIAAQPTRERLWELLIRAQYRSGRQADALTSFSRAREILADELGIDPGPALRAIHAAVLAQDPALDPPSHRAHGVGTLSAARLAPKDNDVKPAAPTAVALLGMQQITVDGKLVTALSTRAVALLTYLVLHRNSPQLRHRLSGLFWPESSEMQARTNLRRELHTLRTALSAANELVVDTRTIVWRADDDCAVDVVRFQVWADAAEAARRAEKNQVFRAKAVEAIALYRGDLAPGLDEDWVVAERERLRHRCVALLDQLSEMEIALGAHAEAATLLRKRIDLEPLEEVGYRALLQAQALAGDRAAAVQTFHRCVAVLGRELNVEPDPRTIEEYERLVARDAVATEAGNRTPASRLPAKDAPLIGRSVELDILRHCWRRASHAGPNFVVVTGEAGVGKTRLLNDLLTQIQQEGAVTAQARCFPGNGRLALAPVAEWLRGSALRLARDRLDEVWRREVERLVPTESLGTDAPEQADGEWHRHRFFEGLARAVLVAREPTLLLIDDLQWCDDDTLAWLQLVLRLEPDYPLLVIGSARSEELADNPQVSETLRTLASAGLTTHISLAPLGLAETAALAAALPGSSGAADVEQLYRATGGVPLFVVESAQAPSRPAEAAAAPRTHSILEGRIRQLGPHARDTAGLAAAVGRDFTLKLLTAASDLDDSDVVDAVDELWRRRIICEAPGDTYVFVHDLLRDTAYKNLSPPRRTMAHKSVAAALEALFSHDPNTAAATAEQHEQAAQYAQAIPHYVRAAEFAALMFANHDALRHYRRAADLLDKHEPSGPDRDRTELAIRQAMCAPLTARQGYAATELQNVVARGISLAENLGETAQALLGSIALFGVRYVQGHIRESYDIGRTCLRLSERHLDLAGQAHLACGGAASGCGHHREALAHFDQAAQLCGDGEYQLTGSRVDVFAPAWGAHSSALLDRRSDAARAADRAVERAQELDSHYSLAIALAYGAITHQLLGNRDRMFDHAEQLRAHCARFEIAYYAEWGAVLRGWAAGGLDGAHAIESSLSRLRQQGALARMPYYQGLLAETLLSAGYATRAGAILQAALAQAAVHGDVWYVAELWRLEARRHSGNVARRYLHKAIALADRQQSLVLLRRATTDLSEVSIVKNGVRTP